jgi:hypothetical protein
VRLRCGLESVRVWMVASSSGRAGCAHSRRLCRRRCCCRRGPLEEARLSCWLAGSPASYCYLSTFRRRRAGQFGREPIKFVSGCDLSAGITRKSELRPAQLAQIYLTARSHKHYLSLLAARNRLVAFTLAALTHISRPCGPHTHTHTLPTLAWWPQSGPRRRAISSRATRPANLASEESHAGRLPPPPVVRMQHRRRARAPPMNVQPARSLARS